MATTQNDTVRISEPDATRLSELADGLPRSQRLPGSAQEALEELLGSAEILPAASMPPGVVTMNSRVLYEDLAEGVRREVSVVYPRDADPDTQSLSVFSPLGRALLGRSTGCESRLEMPNGDSRPIRIVQVGAAAAARVKAS